MFPFGFPCSVDISCFTFWRDLLNASHPFHLPCLSSLGNRRFKSLGSSPHPITLCWEQDGDGDGEGREEGKLWWCQVTLSHPGPWGSSSFLVSIFLASKAICLESGTKETPCLEKPDTLSFLLLVLQAPPLIHSRQMHYSCCNLAWALLPCLHSVPGALLFISPAPPLLWSLASKQAATTRRRYRMLSVCRASSQGRGVLPELTSLGWTHVPISSPSRG